jgi:hypothetical protein
MSNFTNPASRSVGQSHAYTAAILDLPGTRDPLAVLGDTEAALARLRDPVRHPSCSPTSRPPSGEGGRREKPIDHA